MAVPLPVTVWGPVTPLSPSVRVTGVLPKADVTILDNGTPIGLDTAVNPGELWVKVTTQPKAGHHITAVQKNADGVSEPSPQAILVDDVPNPLPVPVIASELNTCMNDVLVTALVPGATVVNRL